MHWGSDRWRFCITVLKGFKYITDLGWVDLFNSIFTKLNKLFFAANKLLELNSSEDVTKDEFEIFRDEVSGAVKFI